MKQEPLIVSRDNQLRRAIANNIHSGNARRSRLSPREVEITKVTNPQNLTYEHFVEAHLSTYRCLLR